MDSSALVNESLAAGAELAAKFDEFMPVKAAFWVKPAEGSQWNLYIASESIDGANLHQGYREVLRLTQEMRNPYLDPFQVKLIGADDPLARAVLAIHERYPGKAPIRYQETTLGNLSIEGAYIYPLPVALPGR